MVNSFSNLPIGSSSTGCCSDASTSEINLVYKAPSDLKDDLCTVDLTVNDNNPIKPMSVKKTV